jgi:exodeoxyribonuclease-3
MALRITTWNVNSVRLRLDLIARFVAEAAPDVLCLQETKVEDRLFPHRAFAELGYLHRAVRGIKGYNGVAVLSRLPLEPLAAENWCRRDDGRHLAARLPGDIELHNLYIPAGGDIPDPEANPKFAHKLAFLDELAAWWRARRDPGARRVLVGDLNVAPLETDVWSHRQLRNVVTHTPVEIERLRAVMAAGPWHDAVRHFVPETQKLFTWWSYRTRDWGASMTEGKDRGRRLDHVWVTPALAPCLAAADILAGARGWPRPSDHVPVTVTLEP